MSSVDDNFSSRIQGERKRLGFSQAGAGEACRVSREIWGRYESGKAVPGGEVFFFFADAGADVQYIMTGVRSAQALSEDEQELISAFRAAPLMVKAAAIGALTSGTTSPTRTSKQVVKGTANQVVGRDLTNHQGVANETSVGTKTRGKRGK